MSTIQEEVRKRRTFAIISHPDAGKTTLTEKLLLYGGAIHLAGAVKAKRNQKHTTADWMEIEKQRGITISASVLQFDYDHHRVNLLDTPGHKDFSEDTYRTLTAADSAVMLIDAAKGVEPQTRKLFEVCRLRGIPIFTWMNKMDRPARDPLDLLDEVEKVLGIQTFPMNWPLGLGDRFRGVYDRENEDFILFDRPEEANARERLRSLRIPRSKSLKEIREALTQSGLDEHDQADILDQFSSELDLIDLAGEKLDHKKIAHGELSPVFFGSALTNFGVEPFLQTFLKLAPSPAKRLTIDGKTREATNTDFSGQVFKIQANMDPQHRDRVAFIRICSGQFERGMEVTNARSKRSFKVARPLNFFAQERVVVETAWPGDILGIVDTGGDLRIGDTLFQGKSTMFAEVPRFPPEYFSQIQIIDPLRRKQLEDGLDQLSEEGVVQIYYQRGLGKKDPVLGAVGALQFEILKARLEMEYRVETRVHPLPFTHARWMTAQAGTTANQLEGIAAELDARADSRCLLDRDQHFVVLFRNDWALRWTLENTKGIELLAHSPNESK